MQELWKDRLEALRVKLRQYNGWGMGGLLVLLGLIAFFLPSVVTFGLETFLGWVLFIQSALYVARACTSMVGWQRILSIALAFLVALAGLSLLWNPLSGVVALTTLLAGYFVLQGLLRLANAYRAFRKGERWIAALLLAFLSMLFGLVLWNSIVMSSMVFIGYMVSVLLISEGVSLLLATWKGSRE